MRKAGLGWEAPHPRPSQRWSFPTTSHLEMTYSTNQKKLTFPPIASLQKPSIDHQCPPIPDRSWFCWGISGAGCWMEGGCAAYSASPSSAARHTPGPHDSQPPPQAGRQRKTLEGGYDDVAHAGIEKNPSSLFSSSSRDRGVAVTYSSSRSPCDQQEGKGREGSACRFRDRSRLASK